jgi:hypothetical protein
MDLDRLITQPPGHVSRHEKQNKNLSSILAVQCQLITDFTHWSMDDDDDNNRDVEDVVLVPLRRSAFFVGCWLSSFDSFRLIKLTNHLSVTSLYRIVLLKTLKIRYRYVLVVGGVSK